MSRTFIFTNRMRKGDYVLMPSKAPNVGYFVGVISGDYVYRQEIEPNLTRPVEWKGSVDKGAFDTESKNSMGSLLTVFEIHGTDSFYKTIDRFQSMR